METTDILVFAILGILVLALCLYILHRLFKGLFAIFSFIFRPVVWVFRLFSHSKKATTIAKPAHYNSLAEFADVVETNPTTIDSNLHAIFKDLSDEIGSIYDETTDEFDKALLAEPLASLEKIANARIKDKSKPLVSSIFDLAISIEDKDIKLDSALRRIFIEIYDYIELYTPNDATDGDYNELAYNIEKVVYPNDGPSEAQANAASKRQAKIAAAIRSTMN